MWKINYDINKLVSPEKGGYDYVTSFKLFIPFKEIGLKLLVRKEQILPILYEIILKLIDSSCNNIKCISEITGVEEEILYDVVGEMSRLELVYPKSNVLVLTPNGIVALKELKKVVLEKEDLNRIYINSITGKIQDLNNAFRKPTEYNPCLFETIKVSDEFINEHISDFNEYYKKRQEDFEVKGNNVNIKNEIYQIIRKEYDNLCYSEVKVYVFKNIRDNDLIYECENDIDNVYGALLSKQINTNTGARSFLKRPSDIKNYLNREIFIDNDKKHNTQNLIQIAKKSVSSKESEDIDNYYFTDRYLFEKEYIEILYSLKIIKPSEILIFSGMLSNILKSDIITELHACLDYCKVIIISDPEEWRIDKIKAKLLDRSLKKKNNIEWIEQRGINRTDIVLDKRCAISINYMPIPVGNDYLIKEISEITFDDKKIKETKQYLLDLYAIK